MAQPVLTELGTAKEVAAFGERDAVTVVAVLREDDLVGRELWEQVAKEHQEWYLFGVTSVGAEDGVLSAPAVLLRKDFDEGRSVYTGPFEEDPIYEFLAEAGTPVIQEIGVDRIVSSLYPYLSLEMCHDR